MSFSLTSAFFSNARGINFVDGGGTAWTFNKNTNTVTATVAGAAGGTVTSVGLADGSTTALYTTSAAITTNGNLTFTLKTQSANTVLAGPSTGAAAQPGYRALVLADLPANYPYANLAGAPTIPVNTSGTFTGTLTGCTTAPTCTVKWVQVGNMVTITIGAVTATSNANTMTITGTIPVGILPATTQWLTAPLVENNGTFTGLGAASVAAGVITFALNGSATGFTNAGTKGVSSNISFTYQLT